MEVLKYIPRYNYLAKYRCPLCFVEIVAISNLSCALAEELLEESVKSHLSELHSFESIDCHRIANEIQTKGEFYYNRDILN